MMSKTGLLVVTNPSRVVGLLPQLQKHLLNKLYIQYLPDRLTRLLQQEKKNGPQINPPTYGPVVIGLYRHSLAHNMDVTVLLSNFKDPFLSVIKTKKPIEVVFFDQAYNGDEVNTFLKSCLPNVHSQCKVISIEDVETTSTCETQNPCEHQVDKMYDNVVLGGTFDRLHAGHKVLLSEAVLRCRKSLTVGVTDQSMLQSKILWELIQPCELRMALVRDFLEEIDPSLHYNIVPISDPFGPTKEDPKLQMIVVSAETVKGGLKVNEVRTAASLPTLDIHSVDLLILKDKQTENEEDKVSSSNLRMRLLGTRLQQPKEQTHLPKKPYVIGLTGGIASGKSSVSERLRKLGATIINCDKMGHELYKKGQPLQDKLVQEFGGKILDTQGEVDRKVLGSIVFNDHDQMQKLNNLIWPELLMRVKDEINKLHSCGQEIIFVEAAVLTQAGWASHFHEIWVCLIPPDEAVKRLEERNELSENDARARLEAQPSNEEHVRNATVVLCTLWAYDYTQKQVEGAWSELHNYLRSRL